MSEDRVAIYCRLSKEDQEKINKGDDSESIQNQKLLLTDYAVSQGWHIYNIYSDDDLKGFDRDRPGYNRLLKEAEQGRFNIVLCKHQSRFTRELEMVEKYLHGEFINWGIRFVSVVDHVDTAVKGTKKSRQIFGLTNEWYSEDLSENIRAVFYSKMKEGQFLGSYACYGYQKDPADRHKLIIDNEAAQIVKEIFNMYLQGNGCMKIASSLTSRGIPTPSAYKEIKEINLKTPNAHTYSISQGVWAANSIRKILRNKMYLGHMVQGKERKQSYKNKKVVPVPEEEWIIVENTHEPVIDEKAFNTVQKLIDNKRTLHRPKYGYKGSNDAHLFAGRARCADCGTNMHRGSPSRDGKTYYLRCQLANKTKSKECTPHSIKLSILTSKIEARIHNIINSYLEDNHNIAVIQKALSNKADIKADIASKKKTLRDVGKKLAEENNYMSAAFKDKVKGVLSENEFIDLKQSLQSGIEKLKAQKVSLEQDIEQLTLSEKSPEDIDALKRYANFECLTHEIVNDFIDFIEIGEKNSAQEQEIRIHWLY